MRWINGFAMVAVAVLLGAGALRGDARPAAAEDAVRTLDLRVERPGQPAVELHFLVNARSDAAARDAALLAARELAPGAAISAIGGEAPAGAGIATAAFALWPWKWDDAELPVRIAYNPANAPAGVTPATVSAALAPWNAVTTSRFRFAELELTNAHPGVHLGIADGQNTIGWLDLGCAEGCVLGVTSKLPDVHEVDVVMNTDPGAGLGSGANGTLDTQSILVHEAGHLAGLEHSCQPLIGVCSPLETEAVMYWRYAGLKRSLGADDAAGVSSLYPTPAGQVPNPPAPIAPLPAPSPVSLSLTSGWNLVVLPSGPLQPVAEKLPCVQAIYFHGGFGWTAWLRGTPATLNTLATIDAGAAYWVWSSAACTATLP